MTADGSVLQVEARALREVPGEGEFPLDRAAGRGAAGHADQRRGPERHVCTARLSPVEFATRNRRGVEALHVA